MNHHLGVHIEGRLKACFHHDIAFIYQKYQQKPMLKKKFFQILISYAFIKTFGNDGLQFSLTIKTLSI